MVRLEVPDPPPLQLSKRYEPPWGGVSLLEPKSTRVINTVKIGLIERSKFNGTNYRFADLNLCSNLIKIN